MLRKPMIGGSRRRPALPGEVCLCGNAAEVVLDDSRLGAIAYGSCLGRFEHPRFGPCPFCGQRVRHAVGADCPAYVLRPAWATEPARHALAAVDNVEADNDELWGWAA